jgi:hypothetical protein
MNGNPAPAGAVPAKKAKKRAADSEALVQLALELLAVSLFTLIAGASNEMGTLVVLFMVGMWLIYLIENSKTIAGLERAMEAA